MRFVDPPALDSPMRGRPEDDLDGLLSAYFRSEMPKPWPTMPLPVAAPRLLPMPLPARKSLFRSRLALVASVAFLLAAPWLLSSSFKQLTQDGPDPRLGSASKLDLFLQTMPNGEAGVRIDAVQVPDKPKEKKVVDDMDDLLPKVPKR